VRVHGEIGVLHEALFQGRCPGGTCRSCP
jgi:hypothetical protein